MFCRDEASEMGLRGWVRNRPDGSVELEAEGPAESLADLASRLKAGPPYARVVSVEESDAAPRGDESEQFEIVF
jgi:acylphosphatase